VLDFLLVLILFFLAVYSSTLAWVPLPAVAAVRAIAPAGGRVDLVAGHAGRRAWRGYCADRMYGMGGAIGCRLGRQTVGRPAIGP
jgi:hypothetical protein